MHRNTRLHTPNPVSYVRLLGPSFTASAGGQLVTAYKTMFLILSNLKTTVYTLPAKSIEYFEAQ